MPTPIEQVPSLGKFRDALQTLGYTTVDHVRGAGSAAPEKLAAFLDLSPAELHKVLAALPSPPHAAVAARPARTFRLGVRLDRIPRIQSVPRRFAVAARVLPAHVDLIPQMPPVRDQAERGTCVAFASLAAMELFWLTTHREKVDLSEQFLYCDCKANDGDPRDGGTWIRIAVQRLQTDGCCLEATWPYVPNDVAGNEGQGPPPPQALAQAGSYKAPGFDAVAPTDVPGIKSELAAGRCVAFSIPVFDSWYRNPEVQKTGEILNPIPDESSDGGHAMCLVGYDDDPGNVALGGGRFRLRNSWGTTDWAYQSVLGVNGYGSIPYSYVARFCVEAYSIG